MNTKNIRFCEKKKLLFAIPLVLIAIGLVLNIILKTQFDIQFTGGAIIRYSYTGDINQDEVENVVKNVTNKGVSVRLHEDGGTGGGNSVSISFTGTDSISLDQQQAVLKNLDETYPDAQFEVISSTSVNPTMGQSFFLKCICAILLAGVLLIVYISFRFKKIGGMSAACMSIVALFHDLLMVYFTFVIFGLPINDSFIAVVLTILGYSLNNTIIIYDRVRENRRLMGPKADLVDLVDASINQTLSRSIYTSLSTFLVVTAVFVVGMIYNLNSITTFALPLMVGILAGCYSSVCIAGPLYVTWQQHKRKKAAQPKAAK